MELMTPVSMALTSFGVNKFISGASHDLRFTIGQHGVTGAKSYMTVWDNVGGEDNPIELSDSDDEL